MKFLISMIALVAFVAASPVPQGSYDGYGDYGNVPTATATATATATPTATAPADFGNYGEYGPYGSYGTYQKE